MAFLFAAKADGRRRIASVAACLMAGVLSVAPTVGAFAHGYWPPQHGGVMSFYDNEISFEMVRRPEGLYFYASDHGSPLEVEGAQGKIWIENTKRAPGQPNELEYVLTPAAGHLLAKGVRLEAHKKLTIRVTFADRFVGEGGFDLADTGSAKAAAAGKAVGEGGFGGLRLWRGFKKSEPQ